MICNSKPNFTMRFLAAAVVLVSLLPAHGSESDSDSNNPRIRNRRYYDPWTSITNRRNSISVYDASSRYPPSPYPVPRPYYIPVYGRPGSLMFYPPQPVYVNPGVPRDNPPFGGGQYLPPKGSPHFQGDKYLPPPVKVPIRGGFMDDDDEERPVWGRETGVAQNPLSGDSDKESGPVPTRAPITRPQPPPLVHEMPKEYEVRPQRPLLDNEVSKESAARPTSRPAVPPLRTTPSTPRQGPSNCVWAIISCCNVSNPNQWAQNCFEQRGCPGPFWGTNPCSSEYSKAAIESAVKFYNE